MELEEVVKTHGKLIENNMKHIYKIDKRLTTVETETKINNENMSKHIEGLKSEMGMMRKSIDRTESKVDILTGKVDQFNTDNFAEKIGDKIKNRVVLNMNENNTTNNNGTQSFEIPLGKGQKILIVLKSNKTKASIGGLFTLIATVTKMMGLW